MQDEHPSPHSLSNSDSSSLLYLVCFTEKGFSAPLEGTMIIPLEEAAAVIAYVDKDAFCGENAEKNLQDPAWIIPRAKRHVDMIQAAMATASVFPIPFGTIFSGESSFLSFYKRNSKQIASFLIQMKEIDEWSVKGIFFESTWREKQFAAKATAQAELLSSLPEGARYLQQKRMKREVEQEQSSWLRSLLEKALCSLNEKAKEVVGRNLVRLQEEQQGKVVSNWAFLVNRTDRTAFLAEVEVLNSALLEKGVRFECTGPWPPFSFTPALEQGGAA